MNYFTVQLMVGHMSLARYGSVYQEQRAGAGAGVEEACSMMRHQHSPWLPPPRGLHTPRRVHTRHCHLPGGMACRQEERGEAQPLTASLTGHGMHTPAAPAGPPSLQEAASATLQVVPAPGSRLQRLPLWRVEWAVLPFAQGILHVHAPHYAHMFEALFAQQQQEPHPAPPSPGQQQQQQQPSPALPPPQQQRILFGHLLLPSGSRNLSNPEYALTPGSQAPLVGVLMQVCVVGQRKQRASSSLPCASLKGPSRQPGGACCCFGCRHTCAVTPPLGAHQVLSLGMARASVGQQIDHALTTCPRLGAALMRALAPQNTHTHTTQRGSCTHSKAPSCRWTARCA